MNEFRFSLEQLQKMECEAEYGNCPNPRSISPVDLCELIHGYKIGAGYVVDAQETVAEKHAKAIDRLADTMDRHEGKDDWWRNEEN